MNFQKISKARSLFKESGAIRREYIRDEIAYSWIRSRLYSKKEVEFKDEEVSIFLNKKEISPDEIIDYIYEKLEINKESYSIFIVGDDGKIKNTAYKNTILGINTPKSFREEYIGTNGISMAFSLKKSMIVYASEHYNDIFDEYISACILDLPFEINKGVLALIAKSDVFDVEIIGKIRNLDYNISPKTNVEINNNSMDVKGKNVKKTSLEIPYCLMGKSKETNDFKKLVMLKALNSSLINIYGSQGSGKEYLARFIHENSNRSSYRFIKINPRHDIEYVINRAIDDFQKGTLYIENIGELKASIRAKLQRKIDSKLVNSRARNQAYSSYVSFIVSNENQESQELKDHVFLTSLKLEIRAINNCEEDLQYIISKLIEKKLRVSKEIRNLEIFSPIYVHEKSKEALGELLKSPLLSYRNLEKSIDDIIDVTSGSIEVKQLKGKNITIKSELDSQKNRKFKTLKDLEFDYICEVLDYTGDNIAKTSEILGIGRTTIYRKLKNINK